jgi:hypothetical protein
MPADTLLWDEDACLDAIKVFVVAACKGAVKSGDVYRWRPSAVPATTTRPSILLAPVNELPVLSSPMGEESDTAQRQRWAIEVDTAAEGEWVIGALGQTAAPFVAGALDTPATIRDGLVAALDALALALATSSAGAAGMGILGDVAGVSLGVTLTPPDGGAVTIDIVDDNIRRAVYNWGIYTVRLLIRDTPSAERTPAAGRRSVALGIAGRVRLYFQSSSLPVVNGSAYPYRSDLLALANARLSWRQTHAPRSFSEQDAGGWTRGVMLDVDFDVPCALLHDVPSLDAIALAAGPDVV